MDEEEGGTVRLSLSDIAGPGEAEWWFDTPTEQQQQDVLAARAAWSRAISVRMALREALEQAGLVLVERGESSFGTYSVLPTRTEVWVGEAGTVTVQLGHDVTDPRT